MLSTIPTIPEQMRLAAASASARLSTRHENILQFLSWKKTYIYAAELAACDGTSALSISTTVKPLTDSGWIDVKPGVKGLKTYKIREKGLDYLEGKR